MAKVKKETGVTGERNANGKAAGRKRKSTTKTARKRPGKRPAARKSATTTKGRKLPRADAKRLKAAPKPTVAVKSLDPLRKCGPNTSVQFLYRVDEEVDGRNTPHLVFFDRHGWYCEHGRSCPAVGHARKFNGQIARVS